VRLAEVAHASGEIAVAQRLGYRLERTGHADRATALVLYVQGRSPKMVAIELRSVEEVLERDRRWHVIVSAISTPERDRRHRERVDGVMGQDAMEQRRGHRGNSGGTPRWDTAEVAESASEVAQQPLGDAQAETQRTAQHSSRRRVAQHVGAMTRRHHPGPSYRRASSNTTARSRTPLGVDVSHAATMRATSPMDK
jgi:hypothetical protein